ncbi:MAG: YesL family protein [Enterocloster sp.]
MLQGLFNYDNPVWRFIGKLGDLMILNLLWCICSIPVFTIGASTTAVYYVTLKLVRDEDDSTIKGFFHSFKENFRQATAIWLILLAAGALLGFDFWFFFTGHMSVSGTARLVISAVFGGMLLILLFIAAYVFPLQSRFYNPVKRTLFNAFFMSVRHLLQTIGILGIDVFIAACAYLTLFYLPQMSVLLILFGFPLIAFVNSFFFNVIFKKYMPEERKREESIRPLFEEEDSEVDAAIENLKNQ